MAALIQEGTDPLPLWSLTQVGTALRGSEGPAGGTRLLCPLSSGESLAQGQGPVVPHVYGLGDTRWRDEGQGSGVGGSLTLGPGAEDVTEDPGLGTGLGAQATLEAWGHSQSMCAHTRVSTHAYTQTHTHMPVPAHSSTHGNIHVQKHPSLSEHTWTLDTHASPTHLYMPPPTLWTSSHTRQPPPTHIPPGTEPAQSTFCIDLQRRGPLDPPSPDPWLSGPGWMPGLSHGAGSLCQSCRDTMQVTKAHSVVFMARPSWKPAL